MKRASLVVGLSFVLISAVCRADDERDQLLIKLDKAHAALLKDSTDPEARLAGADTLQKLGYPHSALFFLKRIGSYPNLENKMTKSLEKELNEIYPGNESAIVIAELDLSQVNVPTNSLLALLSARNHFAQNNWARTRAIARFAASNSEYFDPARRLSSAAAIQEGDADAALNDLAPLLTKNNKAVKARLQRARILYWMQKFDDAIDEYRSLFKDPNLASVAHLESAWAHIRLKQFDKAVEEADAATDSDALTTRMAGRRAMAVALLQLGKASDARSQMKKLDSDIEEFRQALDEYEKDNELGSAPKLIKKDTINQSKIIGFQQAAKNLQDELNKTKDEDHRDHPVFAFLASALKEMADKAQERSTKEVVKYQTQRKAELATLGIHGNLIRSESFLVDYDLLKKDFNQQQNEKSRKALRQEGPKLLSGALEEIASAVKQSKTRLLNVEFRQAELLWEMGNLTFQNGTQEDDKALLDSAQQMRHRALALAQPLLEENGFSKTPQLMYFVGMMRAELGQKLQAAPVLNKFVTSFPNHPNIGEAHLILGDLAFDNTDFKTSEKHYLKILSLTKSPVAGYAHYKLAWCYYRTHRNAEALVEMEKALTWTDQWQQNEATKLLAQNARRDLLALYAEVGELKQAQTYFTRFATQESQAWVVELAQHLEKSAQYEKAEELYRILIGNKPSNPENLAYFNAMLATATLLKDQEKFLNLSKEVSHSFSSQFGKGESASANAKQTEKLIREALLDGYTQFSANASKSGRRFIVDLDSVYGNCFGTWAEAQEPLFKKGQLALDDKDYPRAGELLGQHWTRFNATLDAANREAALRLFIHAQEKLEENEKGSRDEMSSRAAQLVQLGNQYVTEFTLSKYRRPTAFLVASLYFKYQELDKGIEASKQLFDFNPRDEFGKRSFQNLKVAMYAKKDWEGLYRWISDLSARKFPGIEDFSKEITTIKGESLFLWAENTSDDLKSAGLFVHLSDQADLKHLWEKALYNAFVRYHRAGKKIDALKTADRLERVSPNFPELIPMALIRAGILQEAASYEQALTHLNYYLSFERGKVTPESQQVRLNSALILEALGKKTEAARRFTDYLGQAQATAAGRVESERALARISRLTARAVSTVRQWSDLVVQKEEFEHNPVPKQGDLTARVKVAANQLEKLTKAFLKVANDPQSPDAVASEALCAVPNLYATLGRNFETMSFNFSGKTADDLNKLSLPLADKAKEIGQQCLKRAWDSEQDGKYFREVNQKWGWEWDPIMSERVRKLIAAMDKSFPLVDAAAELGDEASVMQKHLEGTSSADSWYFLSKLPYDQKLYPLSRLTAIDGVAKHSGHGKLWNLIAILQWKTDEKGGISGLLSRAAKQGSKVAIANLAYYDLKRGKLTTGTEALKEANSLELFDDNREVKSLVNEWVKK